jgi:hypothetical protein
MTTGWLIACVVYFIVAALIVAFWNYGSCDEDDREWGLCAVVAVLWPLWLIGGVL